MLKFNNYYSYTSLFFNVLLETNFYRYTFLSHFTTLKKNNVLGYNLFSRLKGFSFYDLKNNILKTNFDYLSSKTLNKKIFINQFLNFDYFNFWSDSQKKYQDASLKDLFISLNKKKKLKPLNNSLDYTIMDNNVNKYNLNDYTDIIYIHKYDLLYSLNFNLFYNVKHHLYLKIWLLNYYFSLNSIYFNKFLGESYWNVKFDFSYFNSFYNFIKMKILSNSFHFLKNYNLKKYIFLNYNLKNEKLFILKKKNKKNQIKKKKYNLKILNNKYNRFYPLKFYKRKIKISNIFYKKNKYKSNLLKINLNFKKLHNNINTNIVKFNKYFVKKIYSNKFKKYLENLSIKIYKFYLKFINLKNILILIFKSDKSVLNSIFNLKILLKSYKAKINILIKIFNKRVKKVNKLIDFFYSFIKNFYKKKKKNALYLLPYSKNRKYIKNINSYFYYCFKYIYFYFLKKFNKSSFIKKKILKYFTFSIVKNLVKNISAENFFSIIKKNKLKNIFILSRIYKNFMPFKKKILAWKKKKKIIIKKKLENESNYKRYIKKKDCYYRIKSFKLSIKWTAKLRYLIDKRAKARKAVSNNSIERFGTSNFKSFKSFKDLNDLKFKKPKLYAKYIKMNKKIKFKLGLINLVKLKKNYDQNSIVLTIFKKIKHPYDKHFEVLNYFAKYFKIPFILEELIPPALLHSIEIYKNIDKYDISNLPTYSGTNILKKNIISDSNKKLFKSTLCENLITRRIYFDIYKCKKSIYEYLGIDNIIDLLKFYNPNKNIKEYEGMYKFKKKFIPNYFNYTIKFDDIFYENLEKEFGYPFEHGDNKNKECEPLIDIAQNLKSIKKKNSYFSKFFQNIGKNPYIYNLFKNKLKKEKFVNKLKKANIVTTKSIIKNILTKNNKAYYNSNFNFKYWKLFNKIFNILHNFKNLSRNIIFKNYISFKNLYFNLNKMYSIVFIFFIKIYYKFIIFLIKIKKFKGFFSSIKKAYKRFTYRLKYYFVYKQKFIKKKKILLKKKIISKKKIIVKC